MSFDWRPALALEKQSIKGERPAALPLNESCSNQMCLLRLRKIFSSAQPLRFCTQTGEEVVGKLEHKFIRLSAGQLFILWDLRYGRAEHLL